ncbi:hypothetical protein [Salinigranum halophilum]|jgi:hypothetical protein|uniref:hypothetical protein n=1 Tax=Salinigranum halophilum TaxID=2565931 RepID=UPI0010A8838E|nr:hypothetical protein [Salinigranum halophilum]
MALNLSKQGLVGVVLMLVGVLAFLPGLAPSSGQVATIALLPAALLLTYGTYLVGTDGGGRPV